MAPGWTWGLLPSLGIVAVLCLSVAGCNTAPVVPGESSNGQRSESQRAMESDGDEDLFDLLDEGDVWDPDGSGCDEPVPYFEDLDGDGHGNPEVSVLGCKAPEMFVASGDDCNDQDEYAFPGQVVSFEDPWVKYTDTGEVTSFDYDCDGQATPETAVLPCVYEGSANSPGTCSGGGGGACGEFTRVLCVVKPTWTCLKEQDSGGNIGVDGCDLVYACEAETVETDTPTTCR